MGKFDVAVAAVTHAIRDGWERVGCYRLLRRTFDLLDGGRCRGKPHTRHSNGRSAELLSLVDWPEAPES